MCNKHSPFLAHSDTTQELLKAECQWSATINRHTFQLINLKSLNRNYSIPGEGNGHPLQYSCLANPMDGGAWWAAVHRVTKTQTRLSDFTFTFHFHALEKEMATHSSVLAWRIPGTGEPGGLPSGVAQSRTRLKQLSSSSSSRSSKLVALITEGKFASLTRFSVTWDNTDIQDLKELGKMIVTVLDSGTIRKVLHK